MIERAALNLSIICVLIHRGAIFTFVLIATFSIYRNITAQCVLGIFYLPTESDLNSRTLLLFFLTISFAQYQERCTDRVP